MSPQSAVCHLSADCPSIVYSAEQDIRSLDDVALPFCPETAWKPSFFLATLEGGMWLPRVSMVERNGEATGIVYAKERRLFGVPSRILYADGSLVSMVVAAPCLREAVLRTALAQLWSGLGARSLRAVIPPDGFERRVLADLAASKDLDISYASLQNHCQILLPDDYETYLRSVGYKTRRNFRYYRRQCEAEGDTFVSRVPMAEFREAARRLRTKCRIPSRRSAVQRALKVIEAAENPLLIGLRRKDGEWVSVGGGWHNGDRATLFFQLNNDHDYPRASLSTVLRVYLVEMLIRDKVRQLLFWAGSSGPFAMYATRVPALAVFLDARTPGWRLLRWLAAKVADWFPHQIGDDIRWVAGSPREGAVLEADHEA